MAKRTKKPNKYPVRVETPFGTLLIQRNRKGELYWRVLGHRNNLNISGSTEGHERIEAIRRSIEITFQTLNDALSKVTI